MVRTRSFLIAVVATLALGAGACKKKDEAKGNAPADKTTETKAGDNPVTKSAGAGAMIQGGEDLALIPSDSEVVLGFNFAQLQQSALWKQFSPKLMEKVAGDLAEFKAKCGFDPMEKFKSVSMGMKNVDQGKTPEGGIVVHGLEKAATMACLDKAKADMEKKGTTVAVDGDVFTMKGKDGETMAWTFINNDTMFGVMGANASKDTLMAAAKGANGLKSSATFTEMYSKINTKESLWFLVNGNAPFMAKAASAGIKPKAVFGSVNVSDGLTVDVRVRMATAEEATNFVNMMKGQTQSAQVKQMFDKLDVAADATDAKISVAMSNQKLQQLAGMLGGMMGGMMGAGGGMGGP